MFIRLFAIFCIGASAAAAFGQTAGMQSFQGLIRDNLGNPITSPVNLEFRIFDASINGNQIAGPFSPPSNPVAPTNGIVSTKFGPVLANVFNGSSRYLEVRVNGTALSRVEMAMPSATAEQVNRPGSGQSAIVTDTNGNVGIGTPTPGQRLDVSGNGNFSGGVTATSFSGGGSGLNNLNASNISSGTVPSAQLSGTYSNALSLNSASNSFTGNGGGLSNLSATNVASGTLNDGRLSSNIPRLNAANSFTGFTNFFQNMEMGSFIDFRIPGSDNGDFSARVYSELVSTNRRLTVDFGLIGVERGVLRVNGDLNISGTCTGCSDSRLKKKVITVTSALAKLLALRGVTFEWKRPTEHGGSSGTQMGFIAQEVERILPSWVTTESDGMKYLSTQGFPALAVEAVRELNQKNETLQRRVIDLEKKNGDLEARLAKLETVLGRLAVAK